MIDHKNWCFLCFFLHPPTSRAKLHSFKKKQAPTCRICYPSDPMEKHPEEKETANRGERKTLSMLKMFETHRRIDSYDSSISNTFPFSELRNNTPTRPKESSKVKRLATIDFQDELSEERKTPEEPIPSPTRSISREHDFITSTRPPGFPFRPRDVLFSIDHLLSLSLCLLWLLTQSTRHIVAPSGLTWISKTLWWILPLFASNSIPLQSTPTSSNATPCKWSYPDTFQYDMSKTSLGIHNYIGNAKNYTLQFQFRKLLACRWRALFQRALKKINAATTQNAVTTFFHFSTSPVVE